MYTVSRDVVDVEWHLNFVLGKPLDPRTVADGVGADELLSLFLGWAPNIQMLSTAGPTTPRQSKGWKVQGLLKPNVGHEVTMSALISRGKRPNFGTLEVRWPRFSEDLVIPEALVIPQHRAVPDLALVRSA